MFWTLGNQPAPAIFLLCFASLKWSRDRITSVVILLHICSHSLLIKSTKPLNPGQIKIDIIMCVHCPFICPFFRSFFSSFLLPCCTGSSYWILSLMYRVDPIFWVVFCNLVPLKHRHHIMVYSFPNLVTNICQAIPMLSQEGREVHCDSMYFPSDGQLLL